MVMLNHDMLLHVAEYLESKDGYRSLSHFALINKAFNEAASKLLYRRIVLSPEPTLLFRLGRHDQELVRPIRPTLGWYLMSIYRLRRGCPLFFLQMQSSYKSFV